VSGVFEYEYEYRPPGRTEYEYDGRPLWDNVFGFFVLVLEFCPVAVFRSSGFPARALSSAHISLAMRLSRRFALPVARAGGKAGAVWLIPTPSRSRLAEDCGPIAGQFSRIH